MSREPIQTKTIRRRIAFTAALLAASTVGCKIPRTHLNGSASLTPATVPQSESATDVKSARSPAKRSASSEERVSATVVYAAAAQELSLEKQTQAPPKDKSGVSAASEKDQEEQSKENSDKVTDQGTKTATDNVSEDSQPKKETVQTRESVGVESLIAQATAVHPKLQAARSRVAAAQNRIPQASALPDPTAETMFWPIAKNAQQLASGRMTNQLALSQTVPWPDKLRTQAEVAIREVGMAQAEMREIEREIIESVKLAYYEIWFSSNALRIVKENRRLTEQIVKITQNRARSGGSQQDVLRAELEVEKRDQQVLEIDQQLQVAQADLATQLQQPIDLIVQPTESLRLEDVSNQLDSLLATAQQCNPTLQNLASQIQRDLQKQRLATLQKYPDLTYGVQYGMMTTSQAISPVADGIDNLSFTVGTTLPVWKTKIRAGICEAASERASSTQLHRAEWNSIAGRLRRLTQQAHSFDQQLTLYRDKLVPRAEQTLKISQSEFVVGKTSFVQLTDNITDLLNFQVEIARIEASLAGVLAQIERTIGCEVDAGGQAGTKPSQ